MLTGQLTPNDTQARHQAYVQTVDDALIWLAKHAATLNHSRGQWIEVCGHPALGDCVLVSIAGTPTTVAEPSKPFSVAAPSCTDAEQLAGTAALANQPSGDYDQPYPANIAAPDAPPASSAEAQPAPEPSGEAEPPGSGVNLYPPTTEHHPLCVRDTHCGPCVIETESTP